MALKTTIIDVTAENIDEHPQAICFINPKHELYHQKVEWLTGQFEAGLKIKLLYLDGEKKPVGFIEYTPGVHCWRSVTAPGYMFIHCLWTKGKKYQHQGLGKRLIDEVERDAKDMTGVAVITSTKSFMAKKDLFIKHGYQIVSESKNEQLLAKSFKEGPAPVINDWESELKKHQDLTIIYSKQCPWVARFMEEVKPILKKEKLKPKIIELGTPEQAQQAPSCYSVFNLIYKGNLLADRNISITRFLNIVKKDIKP